MSLSCAAATGSRVKPAASVGCTCSLSQQQRSPAALEVDSASGCRPGRGFCRSFAPAPAWRLIPSSHSRGMTGPTRRGSIGIGNRGGISKNTSPCARIPRSAACDARHNPAGRIVLRQFDRAEPFVSRAIVPPSRAGCAACSRIRIGCCPGRADDSGSVAASAL